MHSKQFEETIPVETNCGNKIVLTVSDIILVPSNIHLYVKVLLGYSIP